MTTVNIIITLLGSIGMTFIVTQSSLFKGIRMYVTSHLKEKWHGIVTCPMCFGFHAGWFNTLGILFVPYYFVFMFACIGSLLSFVLYLLLKDKLNV